MTILAIFTTIDSREKAQEIADALVERNLAACVQISAIESVYRWQGKTQHEPEYRLMVKTVEDRYAEIEAVIRELHTYDLPAVYAVDMSRVSSEYADWVLENSSG